MVLVLSAGMLPAVERPTQGAQVRKSAGIQLSGTLPVGYRLVKSPSIWPVTVQPVKVPRESLTFTVCKFPVEFWNSPPRVTPESVTDWLASVMLMLLPVTGTERVSIVRQFPPAVPTFTPRAVR
jgi:hypothetical protein